MQPRCLTCSRSPLPRTPVPLVEQPLQRCLDYQRSPVPLAGPAATLSPACMQQPGASGHAPLCTRPEASEMAAFFSDSKVPEALPRDLQKRYFSPASTTPTARRQLTVPNTLPSLQSLSVHSPSCLLAACVSLAPVLIKGPQRRLLYSSFYRYLTLLVTSGKTFSCIRLSHTLSALSKLWCPALFLPHLCGKLAANNMADIPALKLFTVTSTPPTQAARWKAWLEHLETYFEASR
ncbi:hypothetical protein NDU88_003807 [Pleurodeles waltl]|uniref:Uncharacterized protein n=1 Tax=Pleurodeles waltl TaxID=8319 RepID=A0AAV7WTH6_PLEWA|nr:hypothetical protein NDU88_003807 [Pleurodeles waltl]